MVENGWNWQLGMCFSRHLFQRRTGGALFSLFVSLLIFLMDIQGWCHVAEMIARRHTLVKGRRIGCSITG